MDWEALKADFILVAGLAGITLSPYTITVQMLRAPHTAPRLPAGKMAVYIFLWGDQCLKVGKVRQKTHARYTYQHYCPNSSMSNLAKSILREREGLGLIGIDERSVGKWIKENTDRLNFLLDGDDGAPVLSLLEAFVQCRLKPRFEG